MTWTRSAATSSSSATSAASRERPGDLGGEVDLERVADDRGAVEQRPRVGRQRRRLAQHRLADRLRHLGVARVAVTRDDRPPAPTASARASCIRWNGLPPLSAYSRRSSPSSSTPASSSLASAVVSGPGASRRASPAIGRAAQLRVQRRPDLAVPVGDGQQQPRGRRAADERGDERDRGRVGPVEVVEQQDEPARRGQPLEQRPDRAVQLVALDRDRRRRTPAGPGTSSPARRDRPPRARRAGPCAARCASSASSQQRVRDVALVLRAAPAQDQRARPRSGGAEMLEQRRLADPRLADDLDHGETRGRGGRAQRFIEHGDLTRPADERGAARAWGVEDATVPGGYYVPPGTSERAHPFVGASSWPCLLLRRRHARLEVRGRAGEARLAWCR